MNGLLRGTVEVVKHDSTWKQQAERTISLLKEILQEDMVDAQHVGSTAISGICAKPIIDIAIGVNNLQDILKYNDKLAVQGIYYWKQEHGDQLLYVCGDLEHEIITHHIHVMVWNCQSWKNYLNFRDYMNCHEEEASEYAHLKEQLALQYSKERKAYTAGKQEFIYNILQKAALWRDGCK